MFKYFPVDTDPKKFAIGTRRGFSDMVALWQSKSARDAIPAQQDFKLKDFIGWHARMAISEILPSTCDIRFQYFGSDMVMQQDDDLTGTTLSERLPEAHEKIYRAHIARFLESPVFAMGQVQAASDKEKHISTTMMYLPLADDGQNTNKLIHLTCRRIL